MKKLTKTLPIIMALALVITAMPVSTITAEAATKKPAAVTKVTKKKATTTSLKIKIKKAKRAKGYQIRVYKNKNNKLVKSVKTKKTTYTIKGLSANTTYKIKVRAYAKSGKKTVYGKTKTITYKTKKKASKNTDKEKAYNYVGDDDKVTKCSKGHVRMIKYSNGLVLPQVYNLTVGKNNYPDVETASGCGMTFDVTSCKCVYGYVYAKKISDVSFGSHGQGELDFTMDPWLLNYWNNNMGNTNKAGYFAYSDPIPDKIEKLDCGCKKIYFHAFVSKENLEPIDGMFDW